MKVIQVISGVFLAAAIPAAFAQSPDCGKTDPAAFMERKELGNLTVMDELNKTEYKFAVCEDRDTAKQKVAVHITANKVTGTSWDQEQAEKFAKKIASKGEKCGKRGSPYTPMGKNDHRRIEYLLCQENGKPKNVEVRMTALKADASAQPEKTLTVAWPN